MKILNTLRAWIYAYLATLWKSMHSWKTRIVIAVSSVIASIPLGWCEDTTAEITNVVLAWMPLIIVFAMLGMVLGILKKLGKF